MNQDVLHRYPYLRVLTPWIAGIVVGNLCFDACSKALILLLLCCVVCVIVVFLCYFLHKYAFRWCFGVALYTLCFIGGITAITVNLKKTTYHFPNKEVGYSAILTGTPQEKENSILCPVFLYDYMQDGKHIYVGKQAYLYMEKDKKVSELNAGDGLYVSTKLSLPEAGNNFVEFNFSDYLLHKGVSGTGYVANHKWKKMDNRGISVNVITTIRVNAEKARKKIIALYRKLGFKEDRLAVLAALTIGDKTTLTSDLRESYSAAGVSHVLALSGLHIGLLYGLFFLIFRPIIRSGMVGKICCSMALLIMLWLFAFFTGLSPSVTRACCMFSIYTLAVLFGRNALSMNTLSATALFMLLFNPAWLFDVGFQLSFVAVAFILLLYKPVFGVITVRNRVLRYFWGIVCVSVVAQIATAPLVAYYFSRLSCHFLITNIVVVPFVTLVLYLAVIMLLCTPFTWCQIIVARVLDLCLCSLNGFVKWVEQLPLATIDGIWLYRLEVVCLYVVLLLCCYYLYHRKASNLLIILHVVVLLAFVRMGIYVKDLARPGIAFYNVTGCPAVHFIAGNGKSWIAYADSLPNSNRLERTMGNFWNKSRLKRIELVDAPSSPIWRTKDNIMCFKGKYVCMVTDNRWRGKSATMPLSIDYLYLCKGYMGSIEELTRLFSPKYVVFDSSISWTARKRLINECRQKGLKVVNLKEGSFQISV